MEFQSSSADPEWLSADPEPWLLYDPSPDDALGEEAPFSDEDLRLVLDADPELGSVPDQFDRALCRLQAAADDLVRLAADPELVLAGGDRLTDWARELEQTSNKLACPGQSLINLMEAAGCRIDGPLGLFASPQAFLASLHGIRWADARARVVAAKLLAPTVEMGRRVEAKYPVLAAAQATGEISRDKIELIVKELTGWEKLLDVDTTNVSPETLAVAEEVLARQAKVFGGRQLEQVIERLGAYLNPDGMLDDRPAQEAVRGLEVKQVSRGMNKGTYIVQGRLTAETGAKTLAVLEPLAKPQPVSNEHGDILERDHRDHGMRMHDAFDEVMDRSLHAGDLPAHGGTPTTLIITAEQDDLLSGLGTGITETGDRLPMDSVIALSDEAEVVRTVFHKETREVLYLGRTRRLASYPQTLALVARDGGCTFPGCTKSPKWCQRHHLVDWVKGGPTDLPNLALLCAFHHCRFAQHGWTAEYREGRVWWRPPKIIDPDQKPILNIHHRTRPLIS